MLYEQKTKIPKQRKAYPPPVQREPIIQEFSIYRRGTKSPGNLTPRAVIDINGLSFYRAPGLLKKFDNATKTQVALDVGEKYTKIESTNLDANILTVRNDDDPHGHTSVLTNPPKDMQKWIDTRTNKTMDTNQWTTNLKNNATILTANKESIANINIG